jgi:hypothetical protein
MSQTACQSCGAEKDYCGICHACARKYAGPEGLFPAKLVAQVRKQMGIGDLFVAKAETPDPIYMEKGPLEFLRSWPDVPEKLRAFYPRFVFRGLIWDDPNIDAPPKAFPGSLRLTERGEMLKEIVDAQSFNFFTVEQMKAILPQGEDPNRLDRIFKDRIPRTKGAPVAAEPESDILALLAEATKAAQSLNFCLRMCVYYTDTDNNEIPF